MQWFLRSSAVIFLVAGPALAEEEVLSAREQFASVDSKETPNFRRHVLPLMGRVGCNGRACHGSFQGRGGFRLSLFGYDFEADHQALTGKDKPRVDLTDPASSLMLQKPTLTIAHKGGKRFEVNSWQYRLLLRWVQNGAKNDSPLAGHFERLEVFPSHFNFTKPGDHFQLKVIAHWSDRTREDVTELSRFRSNDESIASISDSGLVTSLTRGDTHVVAFYDNGVAPVQVILPVSELAGAKYPEVPTPTRVDELVTNKLRQLGIMPSELCSDAEFLRRVSLDMTGTLPAPEEVEKFLVNPSPSKRSEKIDELLDSPAYVIWWSTKLCDMTGNNGQYRGEPFGPDYTKQWYDWIYRRVQENVSYDKIVKGIVLATGRRAGQTFDEYCTEMSSYLRKDKPADFSRRETLPHFWTRQTVLKPEDKALAFSYSFLGVHLQCAQCHKHPFDQWTKQDFDQFTAFFSRVTYATPREDTEAYDRLKNSLSPAGAPIKKTKTGFEFDLVRTGKTIPWREVFIAPLKGVPPANSPIKVARPAKLLVSEKKPAVDAKKPAGDDKKTLEKKPLVDAKKAPGADKKPADKKAVVKKKKQAPPGRVFTPKLLGDQEIAAMAFVDPREALMKWMLRKANPYFAKAFVNRVWASYFNVGIVEPADDLNLANPPSNAALFDYLAAGFVEHHYDMKWLHREIANSRTYQLSWKPNATNSLDTRNFSHSVPRRLPAEVAYDAIAEATVDHNEMASWRANLAQRAIGPGAGYGPKGQPRASYLLRAFGKPERLDNCDCERSNDPSLLQTLLLLSDGEIQGLVSRREGWVSEVGRQFRAPATATTGPKQVDPRAVQAKVIANLERRIEQLGQEGKSEDADSLKRVLQAVKEGPRPKPGAIAVGENARAKSKIPTPRPAGPEDVRKLIREAYLRTVSRPPNAHEQVRAEQYLKESPNPAAGIRDLLWALINTDEFIVNH